MTKRIGDSMLRRISSYPRGRYGSAATIASILAVAIGMACSDEASNPTDTSSAPAEGSVAPRQGSPSGSQVFVSEPTRLSAAVLSPFERTNDGGWRAEAPALRIASAKPGVEPVALAFNDATASVSLLTTDVSRGDVRLLGAVGEPHGSGTTLSWSRGAIEERWTLAATNAEQSWRFEERPRGSGELVVRVRVSGSRFLEAREDGLWFADPTNGTEIRYGTGTWIDGTQQRTTIAPAYDEGFIELRVPAPVVDASAYPAVLDPEIGMFQDVGASSPRSRRRTMTARRRHGAVPPDWCFGSTRLLSQTPRFVEPGLTKTADPSTAGGAMWSRRLRRTAAVSSSPMALGTTWRFGGKQTPRVFKVTSTPFALTPMEPFRGRPSPSRTTRWTMKRRRSRLMGPTLWSFGRAATV